MLTIIETAMTKPSNPTNIPAGLKHPARSGQPAAAPPSAKRPQVSQKVRSATERQSQVPADEAVTVPRVPFRNSNEP